MTADRLLQAIIDTIHATRHADRHGDVRYGICDCVSWANWIRGDLPSGRLPTEAELATSIHLRRTHPDGSFCESGPGTIDRDDARAVLAALNA